MEEENSTIEFYDRYGGKMPSQLRGCRGQCEAMGWVPIKSDEQDEPWASLWLEAEEAKPSDDGWHFVKCHDCNGTGRVSWLRSFLRIPGWIWKSACQCWRFTMNPEYRFDDDATFFQRLRQSIYICFWLDIMRLRN